MNRNQYLKQTIEHFHSLAVKSPHIKEHFQPVQGILKVLELEAVDETHPELIHIPFILKGKAIWKESEQDSFLDEFTNQFDLTFLLDNFQKPAFETIPTWDLNTKVSCLYHRIEWLDLRITVSPVLMLELINKVNDCFVIIIPNSSEPKTTLLGDRLLPLPPEDDFKPIFYKFNEDEIDMNLPFYSEDLEIIQVSDGNLDDIFSTQISPFLYFTELNIFRDQYNTQLADTVPISGYYKLIGIHLKPARKRIKDGKEEIQPGDYPYRIIGLGYWLPASIPETSVLNFNKRVIVEIRLNPLFNKISIWQGLPSQIQHKKDFESFFSIINSFTIKINSLTLEDNSYKVDWKVIRLSDKVDKIGFT
jgi:hypothetical protein